MPSFLFRVGTPDGEIVEREVTAMNLEAAREQVAREGLHVFRVQERTSLRSVVARARKGVPTEKFLHFNQELLALVRAGLPILQSLDIMLERQKGNFHEVLTEIRDKVKSGVALSDAFASYGDMFPAIYSTSLRAGERSGDLEGVLRRFLRYQKLIVALRKRVIGALVYPSVLVTLAIGMIFVMLTYVIPKFTEFFAGFGAELPIFTRFIIGLSHAVRQNILLVVGVAIIAIFLIRRWSRTGAGGVALDRLKLGIPFVGTVLHSFAIMQFTQSLGTLLGGGTPMVTALEIATQSVTNRFVAVRLERLAQAVREGEPLWRSLESTKVASDLAVEMIKVGESTGALVEMLTNVSEFYDEEIETRLARMIAMIEPMILVLLGVVIGVLLYAFYLPLFELSRVQQ
ncbi:MAG: type II secretion system F family protein [Thermoanaerobaculia bacterium]